MGQGDIGPVHRGPSRQSGQERISTDQLMVRSMEKSQLTVPWTPALTMMKSDRATER